MMSGGMTIDVKVDLNRLEERLSPEALSRAQELFAIKAADLMTPFVPAKGYIMRPTVNVASDFKNGILTWATPYAHYQYELMSGNRTTPGTNGHWDEALAESASMASLKDYAIALLEGRA